MSERETRATSGPRLIGWGLASLKRFGLWQRVGLGIGAFLIVGLVAHWVAPEPPQTTLAHWDGGHLLPASPEATSILIAQRQLARGGDNSSPSGSGCIQVISQSGTRELGGVIVVTGEAVNNCDQAFREANIRFRVLDKSGALVGNVIAVGFDISPRQHWKFKGMGNGGEHGANTELVGVSVL